MNLVYAAIVLALIAALVDWFVGGMSGDFRKIVIVGIVVLFIVGLILLLFPGLFSSLGRFLNPGGNHG
jgi:hypothetical protein